MKLIPEFMPLSSEGHPDCFKTPLTLRFFSKRGLPLIPFLKYNFSHFAGFHISLDTNRI